jgi:hypothetical protein
MMSPRLKEKGAQASSMPLALFALISLDRVFDPPADEDRKSNNLNHFSVVGVCCRGLNHFSAVGAWQC